MAFHVSTANMYGSIIANTSKSKKMQKSSRNPGTSSAKTTAERPSKEQEEKQEAVKDKKPYDSLEEYMQYLYGKYETMKNGVITISHQYIRECFGNEEKQKELEDMLRGADFMYYDAKEHVKGFQSMKIKVAKDGKMETETSGGSVTFNAAKRARQLAAAKNPAQVRAVLAMLAKDLSDCENGLANGMCDENEVAKVKAMIQKAQQKMSEVMGNDADSKEEPDTFSLNLLM